MSQIDETNNQPKNLSTEAYPVSPVVDQTIIDVRKSPIPPKSIEITFADRYSISIINA